MKKSQLPLDENFQKIDFVALAKQSKSAQGRIRCLAMEHLQEGKSIRETSSLVKTSRPSLYAWLNRCLEDKGKAAISLIEPVKGRGRKNKSPAFWQKDTVKQLFEQAFQKRSAGSVSAVELRELIEKKWHICYSLSAIYWNLKRLGLTWVSARTKHPKSDEPSQEAFKKTFLAK